MAIFAATNPKLCLLFWSIHAPTSGSDSRALRARGGQTAQKGGIIPRAR